MKKHKHADLIKAWADGAEIEFIDSDDSWCEIKTPTWDTQITYRIKPEEKKPVVRWKWAVKYEAIKPWYEFSDFMTDEEMKVCQDKLPSNAKVKIQKLDYTRTEFPE